MEDEAAPKQVLNDVPVPTKDLFSISPKSQKQFCNLTIMKRVTMALANTVELSGHDPEQVSREYGNHILRSENGLIVTHHNLPPCYLDAKAGASKLTINCILDSRSEIIAMP